MDPLKYVLMVKRCIGILIIMIKRLQKGSGCKPWSREAGNLSSAMFHVVPIAEEGDGGGLVVFFDWILSISNSTKLCNKYRRLVLIRRGDPVIQSQHPTRRWITCRVTFTEVGASAALSWGRSPQGCRKGRIYIWLYKAKRGWRRWAAVSGCGPLRSCKVCM